MTEKDSRLDGRAEPELAEALGQWRTVGLSDGERRVDGILVGVRRQVCARDLLIFASLRVWQVVLAFAALTCTGIFQMRYRSAGTSAALYPGPARSSEET